MWKSLGARLLGAGLAGVLTGCESMPDPEFASLERALNLRIVEITRTGSSESAALTLEHA